MSNFLTKEYYIDLDGIVEKCKTDSSAKDEDGQDIIEINIFKYEMIKMLIDRVINEIDDYEEDENYYYGSNVGVYANTFRSAPGTSFHQPIRQPVRMTPPPPRHNYSKTSDNDKNFKKLFGN